MPRHQHRRHLAKAAELYGLFRHDNRRMRFAPNPAVKWNALGRVAEDNTAPMTIEQRGKGMAHRHITHELQVGELSFAYHATKGFRAIRVPRYINKVAV